LTAPIGSHIINKYFLIFPKLERGINYVAGYFLSSANFLEFVRDLAEENRVYGPVEEFNQLHFTKIIPQNASSVVLDKYRPADSIKQFVFNFQEVVSNYFGHSEGPGQAAGKTILLGVKACDLSALEVQDRVYLEGDFKDKFYAARRENLIIISSDCTDCLPTCFCTLVNGQPFSKKNFDLNISNLGEGYLVDIGSPKGQALMEAKRSLFVDASRQAREEQDKNRKNVENKLKENNKKYTFKAPLHEIHQRNIDSPAWREITKNCVECSACNRVCPSCTCFLLVDREVKGGYERSKFWDNCLQGGYAKVAGGGNSRPLLRSRLENRYECKFNYSYQRLSRYTCVGCGRCIEGCMGRIDMREAFKTMEKQSVLSAKLE
jgi:sulfhydrogenase subunit beta (sulfur reductase)